MTAYESTLNFLSDFGTSMKTVLTELATRLGEVVSHVYMVLVRQQMLIGLQNLILFTVFSISTFMTYRFYKKVQKSEMHEEDKCVAYVLLFMIGVFLISNAITYLNIALPYLLNPEYYALIQAQQLLKEIR